MYTLLMPGLETFAECGWDKFALDKFPVEMSFEIVHVDSKATRTMT
jgi:hypothetical protein